MIKKNKLQQVLIHFFAQLFIGLILVFILHTYILENRNVSIYADKIVVAYLVNFLLAVVIFLTFFFLRKKYREQLGFFFMFGSLLKFVVFFVFFYPSYSADGVLTRLEFMAFFIPYLFSLCIETVSLIKFLNVPQT
jgi:cell division protein FtsW (lipid II flippase)